MDLLFNRALFFCSATQTYSKTIAKDISASGENGITSSQVSLEVAGTCPSPPTVAISSSLQTVCAGGTVYLTGTIGGSASSAIWSAPNCTFWQPSSLITRYSPGITTGTVTISLTTNDPDGAGVCTSAVAMYTITVNGPAISDAGMPQTVCVGGTITLSGQIGGSATNSTWYAPSGTFSNLNSLSSSYTPAIFSGTVTLYLFANNSVGQCPAVSSTTTVTIDANSTGTVNAGSNQTVCGATTVNLSGSIGGSATNSTWSAPSGSFSNVNSLTTSYTPIINSGSVTLTLTANTPSGPCPIARSAVVINVNPVVTANAGPPQTVCAGGIVFLAGSFNYPATRSTWSAPSGTFSNPTSLTSAYTPSISSGTVTLYLTTDDPDGSGPCNAAWSTTTITVRSDLAPIATAGPSQYLCEPTLIQLAGSIGGGATSCTWSSASGSFSNINSPTSTYTPSTYGSHNLILTTNATAAGCPAVSSAVQITNSIQPVVDAGNLDTVCAGQSVPLIGTSNGGNSNISWYSQSGTFGSSSQLSTIFYPKYIKWNG